MICSRARTDFGRKFWVRAKFLGLGENFGFGTYYGLPRVFPLHSPPYHLGWCKLVTGCLMNVLVVSGKEWMIQLNGRKSNISDLFSRENGGFVICSRARTEDL